MYCSHCGKALLDAAVVCPHCGCLREGVTPAIFNPTPQPKHYLKRLSRRLRGYGTFWIIVGIMQLLLLIIIGATSKSPGELFAAIILIVIGISNICVGARYRRFANELLSSPRNVVERFEPLSDPIFFLIYNIIFGNVIGIIAHIYYFAGIRGYVLRNEHIFSVYNR